LLETDFLEKYNDREKTDPKELFKAETIKWEIEEKLITFI